MESWEQIAAWLDQQRQFVARGSLERMRRKERTKYVLTILDAQIEIVEVAAAAELTATANES